jgi:membrane protein implicated in regulation of membrane protease activity
MFNLTLLWLIAGAILCLMELFFPTAMVEFTMGLAALLVGLLSLVVPSFGVQVALWMLIATLLLFLVRRWFTPKRRPANNLLSEAHVGETLTEILPGQAGRVLCEGNSWRACSETGAIASGQKVAIVRREGNTLIVRPQ